MLSRHPGVFFSVEELFDTISTHLPESISVKRLTAPLGGAGPKALLTNSLWARKNCSPVNHITGVIHYVSLALPGSRTILTVLDLRNLEGPLTIKKILLKVLWFDIPVRRSAWITVISEATRKELHRKVKVNQDKVIVIPCCVSPRFSYFQRTFHESKPTILQVGTTDNKNIPRLAQALRGISSRLIILGRPTDEQMRILSENSVEYHWVAGLSSEEVVELYRTCDLVTFVSTHEGFGIPIVEGQAIGRPVITSSVSSMPEVAGDAAILVDPFDVTAIRAAIKRVISNRELREELIIKGLMNARRFTPNVIALQYSDLYREVYRKNGPLTFTRNAATM